MIIMPGSKVFDGDGAEYTVCEFVGNGSFGNVYRIERDDNTEIFALKTLQIPFKHQDTLKAFMNEGSLATRISHSNVIRYHYFHDGLKYTDLPPYIIMEYAEGGTLDRILEERRKTGEFFTNDELKSCFVQLIGGMEAINEYLIHRDIKPDNILITNEGLKITDFGLSKIVEESTRTSTFKGLGCIPYQAPEGWKYEKNTIQMDIYSMGFVFYKLAALKHPFEELDLKEIEDWYNAHLYHTPESPDKVNSNLSSGISQLVMKMQEKSIVKRFKKWSEIKRALEKDNLPKTALTPFIENLLQKRLEEDKQIKTEQLMREKRDKEIADFRKLCNFQFMESILNPLTEFIEEFNLKYEGSNIVIKKKNYKIGCDIYWSSSKIIEIEVKELIDENFYREVTINDYGRRITKKELRHPHYNNRKIMAWGYVEGTNGKGFNLLLVEREGDVYGEWYVLINTNNSWSRNPRTPEPFAFNFNELEKEIENIGVMHIYKLSVNHFDLKYFAELMEENM